MPETYELSRREEREVLAETATRAYRHARRLVFDQLPVGSCLADADLNALERSALLDLERAELALRAFRMHAADPVRGEFLALTDDLLTDPPSPQNKTKPLASYRTQSSM